MSCMDDSEVIVRSCIKRWETQNQKLAEERILHVVGVVGQ
jgi:hypothetical protein